MAELIGTFVFVLVGAGSAVASQFLGVTQPGTSILIGALANGMGLAVAVSATMAISGGSLNPAVSVGLFAAKKLSGTAAAIYIVAELAGATLAGIVLVWSLPSASGVAVHWGAPSLAPSITVLQGTLLEAVMTFFLMFAIYGTAVDARAPKIAGFGIGLAVVGDVLLGGVFTGAAMNPARAMGPMLAGSFIPSYWYIYWVGPLVGAIICAVAYRHLLE
jgi:MIP family channel proteins